MHIGKTLSPRGLLGQPLKHFEAAYTIYEGQAPIALIGNLSTRTTQHTRFEEVRSEVPSGWSARTFSSRMSRRDWLFGVVVYEIGAVDPIAFDNISIADEVAA